VKKSNFSVKKILFFTLASIKKSRFGKESSFNAFGVSVADRPKAKTHDPSGGSGVIILVGNNIKEKKSLQEGSSKSSSKSYDFDPISVCCGAGNNGTTPCIARCQVFA
jgi:hypothetical protein